MAPKAKPVSGTNIAFANMDWKWARHTGKHKNQHRVAWQRTTEEIIRGFDPAVICFCEVGDVSKPMEARHLDDLQDLTRLAWTRCGAAAEHVGFLQTIGKPYLTAYRTDRLTCSRYRILSHLYHAQGLERTAQHFLATPAGAGAEERINVINVHAPSGNKRLSDAQRNELLTSLLQSSSLNDAMKSVGHDRYIIAGDFNTGELTHAHIMARLVQSNACASTWKAFRQVHGQHGDMGFRSGVCGNVLDTFVQGHDPKHYPYYYFISTGFSNKVLAWCSPWSPRQIAGSLVGSQASQAPMCLCCGHAWQSQAEW
jgi:hypothetical protein